MAPGDYVSRDYVDARLKAVADQAHTELQGHSLVDDQRAASQQRALDLMSESVNHRLEGMNAWREEFRNLYGTSLSRDAYEREHKGLLARIDVLEDERQRQEGAMSTLRFIILVLSIPGLVGAVIAVFNLAQGKLP